MGAQPTGSNSLPAQTVTQFDMMPYLDHINRYRQDAMHEVEWSKAFIWMVAMVQKKFRAELKTGNLPE